MQLVVSYSRLKKIFEITIIYCCLFPYVSFGLNRMDSQPWALILVALYIIIQLKFEKQNIFIFWLFSIFTTICSILYLENNIYFTELFRAVSNFSIVFFIWMFSVIVHKKYNPINHYLIASWIYFFYAILQLRNIRFLDWVSPNRTTGDRGVTSFAAEPTYFGIILFFLSWLIINNLNKISLDNKTLNLKRKLGYFTLFLNLFTILFISKSSTVLLMLVILTIISVIIFMSKRMFYLFFGLALFISGFTYINLKPNIIFENGLEQSRPIKLIKLVSELEWKYFYLIIYNDESINGRVAQATIPYIGIVNNYGAPGGYHTFENISKKVIGPDNFFHSKFGVTHKIQSFIGVFIYELGFLGIIILVFMGFTMKKENNWKWREILLLFIALIPSVPLGMGLVPLLFGSKVKPKILNNLKQ